MSEDPLALFGRWFEEAQEQGAFEPQAVALATATPDGAPSARMVLMKGFDERGITFFTNYGESQGRRARGQPPGPRSSSIGPSSGRQVRIEGPVTRVERAETEAYARSRERASQLSALASPQSRPIPDRAWLERRVEELDSEHAGAELPVSDDWGGYRLEPRAWEFWEHRPNRLHDRFRYERSDGAWRAERLGP